MLTTFIALAFAASTTTLAHTPVTPRKSLSFGPVHPHAKFDVKPSQLPPTFAPTSSDPVEIARRYANELILPQDPKFRHEYVVREDSYTDSTTGVTHVYLRQLVNGIEVADANININVLNGKVISYGDSFYKGAAPPHGVDPATPESSHQATYCAQLSESISSLRLNDNSQFVASASTGHIHTLHEHNCAQRIPKRSHGDFVEPAQAALSFMIAAAPDSSVSDNIAANFETLLAGVTSTTETHFAGHNQGGAGHTTTVELLHNVPGTVGPVRARLAYVQTPEHDCHTNLALVWKLEVPMENNWYEAAISTSDATRVVEVLDWAADAGVSADKIPSTYNVWKWGLNDPTSGERSLEVSPYDEVASPLGWHSLPAEKDPRNANRRYVAGTIINDTTTAGNNVFAHEDWEGRSNWLNNYRPDGGKDLAFNFTYDLQYSNGSWIDPTQYIDLAVTQLFYTCNKIHDLYHRYGFTEEAGNFQQFNFGRGGKDNDAVIANAQDGSGYNNANFMTPPDGQNGRMRMYTWNVHGKPYRDGDLEAGIVIHEYSHGLSTRLTGGPANSGCLGWGESGGMGEGWGDFLATTIRSAEAYSDWPMGSWAANETDGIRNYPYSTNITINPSTYHTLDKGGYWGVHAIGEVWAQMLFIVSNDLISEYGWSDTLFPPIPLKDGSLPENNFYRPQQFTAHGKPKRLIPKHGNSLIVQLVFDGMKLQPCRPGFFEARDAIIQADENLTGGENFCLLWKGFAKRGLGVDATVVGRTPWGGGVRTDGFDVPAKCKLEDPVPEPEPEEPEYPDPEEPGKHKKHD